MSRKPLPIGPLTREEFELYYITHEDIPLFAADPLREEKLGWDDVIVCRMPNCGRKLAKLPQHLIAYHRKELSISDGAKPEELTAEYRRLFGYNKNAPLCCKNLTGLMSKNTKAQIARRKYRGKQTPLRPFRRGRAPIQAAKNAREGWGISTQQRQRMSLVRSYRPRPTVRARNASGKYVSDWQIAKLRLEGMEQLEIARKLGLPVTQSAMCCMLRRMRFPTGKSAVFFRGEPVTEALLRAHFEDLKFIRFSRQLVFKAQAEGNRHQCAPLSLAEAAEFLGVTKSWIHDRTRQRAKDDKIPHARSAQGLLIFDREELLRYALRRRTGRGDFLTTLAVEKELAQRLGISKFRVYEFVVRPGGPVSPRKRKPRKPDHPLSWDLANKLLSSIASLREEFRRTGSAAGGGRPKALLPSEERELPGKYRGLKAELDLMLRWAEAQQSPITLDTSGEWMCQQSRAANLQILLFWPRLHAQLPAICEQVRNRVRGGFGSGERAKDLLCQEFDIPRAVLERAIFGSAKAASNSLAIQKTSKTSLPTSKPAV